MHYDTFIIEMEQHEVDLIEQAAEVCGMQVEDLVELAILDTICDILEDNDDDTVEVLFTDEEWDLIEYAAGFNGLGVDEDGRGVDEFIYRAVMEAVGEPVEETIEHYALMYDSLLGGTRIETHEVYATDILSQESIDKIKAAASSTGLSFECFIFLAAKAAAANISNKLTYRD
jgi:uncharacterized protein (DUF1778 family)